MQIIHWNLKLSTIILALRFLSTYHQPISPTPKVVVVNHGTYQFTIPCDPFLQSDTAPSMVAMTFTIANDGNDKSDSLNNKVPPKSFVMIVLASPLLHCVLLSAP